MQDSTKEKSNHLRSWFRVFPSYNQLKIYMTIQKYMDRLVPLSVKFFISRGIPPVLIKLPMIQFGYLCKDVGDVLKSKIKEENYQDGARQHDSKDKLQVTYFSPKFNNALNVLSMYNIGRHNTNNRNKTFFSNVENRQRAFSWIYIVNKPRSPHEKNKISQSNILRIITQYRLSLFDGLSFLFPIVSIHCGI